MNIQKQLFKLNKLHYLLFIVLLLSFFLRFYRLGYSTFYGDETKALYTDKTVSAPKFFLDQRKGPVQFGVSWFMENITGGYDEFWIRLPFALAACTSVLVFYLIVQKLFNDRVALFATTMFGFNGFFIAFARIVQYQSFLILFGLLSIYFALRYYEETRWSRVHYLVLSGGFLAFSYLSHYDAIFFDVVVGFILVKKLLEDKTEWRKILKYCVIPALAILSVFYIPYIVNGFMSENTLGYLERRLSGYRYKPNASWYTFWIYNPTLIWPMLTAFVLPIFFKKTGWKENMIHLWFIIPFLTFEYIFSNPGTHIQNYILPLIILIALGMDDLYGFIKQKFGKQLVSAFILYAFAGMFITSAFVFTPGLNNGFPWKVSKIGFRTIAAADNRFQLFLYGFPYDRGWNEISKYIAENRISKIYTDDNDTIAEYYLKGVTYTIPGTNFIPEYYLSIADNQEFATSKDVFSEQEMANYSLERDFYTDGVVKAKLYKLVTDPYLEHKKTP